MPTFVLHSTLIDADVGSIVRWTVADAAELAALVPTTPDLGRVAWQLDTDQIFLLASLVPKWIDLSGIGAGAAVWGAITGTLSLQTDLQAELDVKKPIEISGAGAPGVSTGNGLALGTLYVDTAGNQSYVLVDATTDANVWSSSSGGFANAPDAALFTERADHVNTPTATKGELWLKTDSPHNLVLTDGDDNDRLIVTMDEASGSTVANAVPKFDSVGQIEDITTLTYSTGELKNSNNVASFSAKERSTGPNAAAGYGNVWVKDDAPTALCFTDDTDVDHYVRSSRGATTLGAAATTFAMVGNSMEVTGDGGGNTLATITGGTSGQVIVLQFVDALVTITDDNSHAADSVDLSAAFTSADDTILCLFYDGTSWYEVSRSVN